MGSIPISTFILIEVDLNPDRVNSETYSVTACPNGYSDGIRSVMG